MGLVWGFRVNLGNSGSVVQRLYLLRGLSSLRSLKFCFFPVGFGAWGLRFGAWGLGFGVLGLGFGAIWGLGF